MNFLLLTYDSCRWDVYQAASTPVADSYEIARPALSPANYTYAAHHSFFAGILPNTLDPVPYYNRFEKQLLGLLPEGEGLIGEGQVVKHSAMRVRSGVNVVDGLASVGYRTVGAGAMNWFRQKSLQDGFQAFRFTGTDAEAQIAFVLEEIGGRKPFYGFINFGETHAPFHHKGKTERCPDDVRARIIEWPPVESGPTGAATAAFDHQRQCVEYLDSQLAGLFGALPGDTIVVLTADHGECFGEDGYWGHGVNHAKVFEVPMAVFRLDRQPLDTRWDTERVAST